LSARRVLLNGVPLTRSIHPAPDDEAEATNVRGRESQSPAPHRALLPLASIITLPTRIVAKPRRRTTIARQRFAACPARADAGPRDGGMQLSRRPQETAGSRRVNIGQARVVAVEGTGGIRGRALQITPEPCVAPPRPVGVPTPKGLRVE